MNVFSKIFSFWKSVKPYFDSKCRIGEKGLILVEGDNIISEDDDIYF